MLVPGFIILYFYIIPHFTWSLTSSWALISCCWASCHQNSPRIVWVLFLIATNEPTSSLILSYQQDITCLPQNSPDLSNPAFSPWAYVFIVFGKGKFPLQTQRAWAGFIWERLCCICPAEISWHFGIDVYGIKGIKEVVTTHIGQLYCLNLWQSLAMYMLNRKKKSEFLSFYLNIWGCNHPGVCNFT